MKMKKAAALSLLSLYSLSLLSGGVEGQLPGTAVENQPAITVQQCSSLNSCNTISTSVTIDANWRWAHTSSGTNCYTGNVWNSDICADPTKCASDCVLEGASSQEYKSTYGVSTTGSELNLGFVTVGPYSTNVGSRVYLMEDPNTYQVFKLLNKEFTVDVDSSELGCGLNGALYFIEMDADGGKAKYPGNKAGAKFGTGYCDAQCPHDVKFINGEANSLDWIPSPEDPNSGKGRFGTCCAEMDIWEANKFSTAFTPHPCSVPEQTRCYGTECGDGENRYGGLCDKDGCDFNSYRMGNKTFYGPDMVVDSNKPITVVTQFITDDGTDNGNLAEIRRIYKQNGQVIHNSGTIYGPIQGANSLTDDVCFAQKNLFGDTDDFSEKGGMSKMGESLKRGMVLAMSLWVDYDAHCLWLDSNYPVDESPSKPGVARGSCPTTSGVPRDVIAQSPRSTVTYGNIKWGPIGSTTDTGSAQSTTAPTVPATNPPTRNPTTPKPTQPATQAPTQPATQAPTQPATQAPTQPATQQPATESPVTEAPATEAPVTEQPATQSPTRNPCSPTHVPTEPAEGDCIGSISIQSTETGNWNDGVNDYSQWTVAVSSPLPIYSINLATTASFVSSWQLNQEEDGTYTLNDWRLIADQPFPAGNVFTFGYIKKGLGEAVFSVHEASCGEAQSNDNVISTRSIDADADDNIVEKDVSDLKSSAALVGVSVAVALASALYAILL